jgi:son of sevenless-like protein
MNGFAGQAMAPGSMFVRALYDYDADDGTSLSFRRHDIIQVLTQLESGWWDGYFNGRRGWFPSNYCQIITDAEDFVREPNGNGANGNHAGSHDEGESSQEESQDEYEDLEYNDAHSEIDSRENAAQPADRPAGTGMNGTNGTNGRSHPDGSDQDEEESAFWIPQATPEGRLYYYNTLTGVTRMELPLESLSSANEGGPRDRNVYLPETTRPPPERMAVGYERDEDADYDASGSDAEMRARYGRGMSEQSDQRLRLIGYRSVQQQYGSK